MDHETESLFLNFLNEVCPKIRCRLCDGDRMVFESVIQCKEVATPLTNPARLTENSFFYFPLSCQNCGLTEFFSVDAVIKKPKLSGG